MRLDRTRLLIVDDDPELRELMRRIVADLADEVRECPDGASGLAAALAEPPSALLLDLGLPDIGGIDVLASVKAELPDLPVVVVSANARVESAVEAMRRGALDFVTKPFLPERLAASVRNALRLSELGRRLTEAESRASNAEPMAQLVGCSDAMRALFASVRKLSRSSATVLIQGETGVGKELVARALHAEGPRARGPFVDVNCAAIPADLLENELFGHETGAFTGAAHRRIGKIENANGGTLFLDEVGELDPASQAKLLRVLQTRRVERLGSNRSVGVDVRIVAATNRDLSRDVVHGRFRADLFYRLSVYPLYVAPLRERREDLGLLVQHFFEAGARAERCDCPSVDREAMDALYAYDWPGNVRELENVVRRTLISLEGDVVRLEDLPACVRGADRRESPIAQRSDTADSTKRAVSSLAEIERQHLALALERCAGNLTETARALGIGRTTLYRKLEKYGLARSGSSSAQRT